MAGWEGRFTFWGEEFWVFWFYFICSVCMNIWGVVRRWFVIFDTADVACKCTIWGGGPNMYYWQFWHCIALTVFMTFFNHEFGTYRKWIMDVMTNIFCRTSSLIRSKKKGGVIFFLSLFIFTTCSTYREVIYIYSLLYNHIQAVHCAQDEDHRS